MDGYLFFENFPPWTPGPGLIWPWTIINFLAKFLANHQKFGILKKNLRIVIIFVSFSFSFATYFQVVVFS